MLVVVNTVSALVHLYSIGYMADDPHRPRFFAYLSLFTFAMLMLVTADNLVQMFFGWEGVGLASYLLIGFWYKKPSANAAAIKAFVVNRVGDFGFALGIFGVFWCSARSSSTTSSPPRRRCHRPCTFLWLATCERADADLPAAVHGRDGQVGAVPAAHLAARRDGGPDAGLGADPRRDHGDGRRVHGGALSPLFEYAPTRSPSSPSSARLTAFFAATVGLVQNDIKRVIAYSTCSQLGYMFVALGVGAYSVGMFHLFTHAFFKALLFLGAGSVIHAMHHEQDMRNMGGLRKDPVHLLDDGDRHARADRLPASPARLLLQGRDHRGGLRLGAHGGWPSGCGHRRG
jgi:NADH-quinone oxidoreductase subunit L